MAVPLLAPIALNLSIYASLGDQYGPLLAATLTLGVQTLVLGMVTPYSVAMASETYVSVGRAAGGIYSLSTLGSIVGIFGTVFILIPSFDVSTIIVGLGLVLLLVALPTLPTKRGVATIVFVILLLTPVVFQSVPQVPANTHGGSVVYEKQTPYSALDVVDFASERILYLNGYVHSGMDLANSSRLDLQYTTYFNLGMQINAEAKYVLFIGGGGFSGPKFFLSAYPNVHVDVVEIDPDVIQTAREYFALKPDPRLTIFNEDARVFLGETTKTYDLVILDAYAKTYVPFQLMTLEFFKLLWAHLSQNGIVISNLIGSLDGDTSNLIRAEYLTATSVFNNSALLETVPVPSTVQNIELVLDRSKTYPLNSSIRQVDRALMPELVHEVSNGNVPSGGYVEHLFNSSVRVDDVPLLTDGYAPVESLLNPVTGHSYVLEAQFGRLVPKMRLQEWQSLLVLSGLCVVAATWAVYAKESGDVWSCAPRDEL